MFQYKTDFDPRQPSQFNCINPIFAGGSADKPPQVGIEDFADSSINVGIRFWVPTTSYFDTRFRANAAIYEALKTAEIDSPFTQWEIKILDKA